MLATLSGYKTYAGIPSGDTTADAVLSGLLARVADEAERYCNRVFELTSEAVEEICSGGSTIQLKRYPIVEIDSVEYLSGVASGVVEWTAIDNSNYYADSETGLLIPTLGAFPDGLRNIRVTYRGGWDSDTVSGEWLQSVYEAVDWHFADRRMNQGLLTEAVGAATVTRKSEAELRLMMDRLFGRFRTGSLA